MTLYKLGDVVDYIKGFAFNSSLYSENGKMVVRVSDFTDDSISTNEAVFIEQKNEYEKYALSKGDILIQTVGSWANNPKSIVGKVVRVPKECDGAYLNQNIVKIIPKVDLNPDYLFYSLIANKFSMYCVMRGQGAANQASITLDTVFKYRFFAHNKETQDKIVDVLSKYDELIEVNNQRIKLLEKALENHFKSTYTKKLKSGETKTIRINEIASFVRGISYSSEEIECEEGINLINLKNIQGYGGFRRDGIKQYSGVYKESQIVKENDLIMGVTDMTQDRRTVGFVALIPHLQKTSVISADLIKIESDISNLFLYCLFRFGNVSKYIAQFANGANVLHLKPQAIGNIKIQLPDADYINTFSSFAEPIIEQIELLNQKNDNLIKQRDLLLPRLMSGKLEV